MDPDTRSSTLAIALRPWQPSDAAWYVTARDEEVFRWTRESRVMDQRDCVAALLDAAAGSQPGSLAIVAADDGALVGSLGIARSSDVAELSYWIAAEARGRGAATGALIAGTDMLRHERTVSGCFLLIHPENEASIRVALAAGYEFAGLRPGPAECSGADGLVAVYRTHFVDASA